MYNKGSEITERRIITHPPYTTDNQRRMLGIDLYRVKARYPFLDDLHNNRRMYWNLRPLEAVGVRDLGLVG